MARILLVDDDLSLLEFSSKALEANGYEVETYDNGLDAFQSFQNAIKENKPYSLLLTDIVMPGMDGFELAKKVSYSAPHTKILFMTGFSGMAAKGSDNQKIMSKPFHLKDLITQVENILADG